MVKIKRLVVTSFILAIIISCIYVNNIQCEYYLSQGYGILKSIEDGSTEYTNGELSVDHGVITEFGKSVIYETGYTDADIAAAEAKRNASLPNSNTPTQETSNSVIEDNKKTTDNSQQAETKQDSYSQEDIDAAWTESERVESTCVKVGYISYTNSITGETKTEELPLADHKYAETERKEATCTEAGSITYTCEICGDTYTEEIPALGHEYEWSTTKEATLFTPGEEQYVCKNCGDVSEAREIPATSPVPVAGVIGIIAITIAICGIFFYKKKIK